MPELSRAIPSAAMRDITAKGCGPTFTCSDGAPYKVTPYISTIADDRPGEVRLMVYRIG